MLTIKKKGARSPRADKDMIFEKQIVKAYQKRLQKRIDADGWSLYFSPEDFDGLVCETFAFQNAEGDTLRAYAYYYGEKNTRHPLVFDHGMGCGHRCYMRDVAYLASRGFTVLTYDHTGCGASGGAHIRGLSQSLADLDAFLCHLEESETYGNADFRVVGHSWGAFSTYNIAAFHKTVTHVVPMSGFRCVRAMLKDQLRGLLRYYIPAVEAAELACNPRHAAVDAYDSISGSGVKLYAVHSIDDPVVSYTTHFQSLQEQLCEREGTVFLSYHDRAHNPYNTARAVESLTDFFQKRCERMKKSATEDEKQQFLSQFDFYRMTEPNVELWDDVCAFLNT